MEDLNKEDFEKKETLIKKINERMFKLSKSHKKIARFILDSGDKAVYLTAAKLGEQVEVSESTVVRFAIELGYDCYQSFQDALEEIVKIESPASKRIGATMEVINKSNKHIMTSVLKKDINKIEKTLEVNKEEVFDRFIDKMLRGKRVFILGNRSSSALANYFSFYLSFMLEDVHLINSTNGSEIFEQAIKIKPDDVFIVISFPRYSKHTIKTLKYVKKIGATVLSITDSKDSPIANQSEESIIAKTDMLSLVDSLTAPLSIINAILVATSLRDTEKVISRFNTLETIWEEFDVYHLKAKDQYE